MTLLELVRRINMDLTRGEYVHTIDETRITTQITDIVIETYYTIIDGRDWPNLYQFFTFTETTVLTPTHMTIPNNVMDLQYVKYNRIKIGETNNKFVEVKWLPPKTFMEMVDSRNSDSSFVDSITDSSGILIKVFNDRSPTFYTSLSDTTAIFDSYDSGIDTFLDTNKTQVYGKLYPTLTRDDSTVINLPIDTLSYLLSKAKAKSYILILGEGNQDAEREYITQKRRAAQEAHKVHNAIDYPNYGRVGKK